MEKEKNKEQQTIVHKVKNSSVWRYSRLITSSATFALMLSVIFFVWETRNSDKANKEISENLMSVQRSLSTRYLGIFPEYIRTTNEILREALDKKEDFSADTVVVFEDVLYYGVTSDSEGFMEVNDKLLQLADKGAKVFVVYYKTQTPLFVKNMREQLFSPNSYKQFVESQKNLKVRASKYQEEMRKIVWLRHESKQVYDHRALMDSLANVYFSDIIDKETFDNQRKSVVRQNKKLPYDVLTEMILNERYFSATRDENHEAFENMVNKHRNPIVDKKKGKNFKRQSWQETVDMCCKMDELRESLMEQPYDSICFEHFVKLFGGYTDIMEKEYAYHRNISLIPIEDYLTMSCWMIGNRYEGYDIIIAFPNRYSSTEIGFASRDDNIAQYIHTMLQGIGANYTVKRN